MKILIPLIFLLFGFTSIAQDVKSIEIPYTIEDRERLIRLEERFNTVDERFNAIDKQFESVNQRFDDLQAFLLWGFGVLFSFMGILMGFILWDRRTVVKPIENKQNQLIDSLKEYAKDHPDLKKIIDKAAIL